MSTHVLGRSLGRVMPRTRQRRPDGRPLGDLMLRPGERPSERRPIVTADHQPVMVEEVLEFLAPVPGGTYVDGTLGAGRHTEALLAEVGGRCRVIGVDRDPDALARARYTLKPYEDAVTFVRGSFADLEDIVQLHDAAPVDGILLDLGMSSMQVDSAERGFSFRRPGPLDMRMDPDAPLDAAEVVNTYPAEDLARILRTYGEVRAAGRIARAIVEARRAKPIRTTTELAEIVADATPGRERRRGHPARRVFQAIRIEVNGELEALEEAVRSAPDVLRVGGRVVVLSYHSLEDRLTKRLFDELAPPAAPLPGLPPPPGEGTLRPLRRGAIMPSEAEIERNPRASSARLRVAERIGEETDG